MKAAAIRFDPAYVRRLSGLEIPDVRIWKILADLGFARSSDTNGGDAVIPPTWRPDIDGKADLVEEVARIAGYDALPDDPLPEVRRPPGGVLTPRQSRIRIGRRALAAAGFEETITWSFTSRAAATLFGGGQESLVLANPIAADLDCMRPSILPGLIEAVGRNARRGFPDCALFEIGPVFASDQPADQRTAIAAVLAPHGPRRWDGAPAESLFDLKADLMAVLDELGAPVGNLQLVQDGASPWWRPGRAARLQLGAKTVIAVFGEIHPKVLKALDAADPVYAFEIWLEAIPEPKKRAVKTKPALSLSPLMPFTLDFAFLVARDAPAGDLTRAVQSADRVLITGARVFDVYEGPGVPEGFKSVAVEAVIQPRDKTLADAEIETLSAKIVAAAAKATGAKLRG